jgi:hypothetical protein
MKQTRNASVVAARDRGASLATIARVHGITRERVRQILAAAATDLYWPLNERIRKALVRRFHVFGQDLEADIQRVRLLSKRQLLGIPNLGAKSVALIEEWLHRHAG